MLRRQSCSCGLATVYNGDGGSYNGRQTLTKSTESFAFFFLSIRLRQQPKNEVSCEISQKREREREKMEQIHFQDSPR